MGLLNNPLATMSGAQFLVFYSVVIVLTLGFCWMAARLLDAAASEPAPTIPTAPDPYEIAYLRGGENEVTRLAIFNLMQHGHLEMIGSIGNRRLQRTPGSFGLDKLSTLERAVYDHMNIAADAKNIFRGTLPVIVRGQCRHYEQRLRALHLLADPETVKTRWFIKLAGALIIGGLGAYKLFAALSTGHYNVIFLVIMAIGGTVAVWLFPKSSRLSIRGRAYLRDLQVAFERLQVHARTGIDYTKAFDPNLLLLAGVFGVGALSQTAYAEYPQFFRRGAHNNSSCGTGCGSCGGSSSSGSSGENSGGSSCSSGCGGCGGD